MILAIIIILFIVGTIAIIFSDEHDGFWKSIGIMFVLFSGLCVGAEMSSDYKQGQIDALTGKIKYELKKQPDGSTQWKEKI